MPEDVSISVVIPAHNRAAVIQRSLDSVLRQTRPAQEIIVVNDGSSDDTASVCEKMSGAGVRIVTLAEKNGAQKARNAGIRAAAGDWIAFQDSDDEWLPQKLAKQVARLREVAFHPDTVVYSDCFVQTGADGAREIWRRPHIEGESVLREVLIQNGPLFQGLLTSKAALEKMGLLDENVQAYQEWETSIRLSRFCRFLHVREPLFVYYRHAQESISKNPERRLNGFSYILNKYREEILSLCGVVTWRKHLIHLFSLCFDMGLWEKKSLYSGQLGLNAHEEDRIAINVIINKMSAEDWPAADIMLKTLHDPRRAKALILKALRHTHMNPQALVSIKRWLSARPKSRPPSRLD